MVKNPSANAGDIRDAGPIPGQKDPLEGAMATHSRILQYSFLENPRDREAWQAIVHRVTKSWTCLSG